MGGDDDAGGEVQGDNLLGILPWTQWLTWGFQVMPTFFLVGGYSNGASWDATQAKGGNYSDWFASRVQRLIKPVFSVLLGWGIFAFFGTVAGVERGVVRMATELALIPVWFLAVYLLVTVLAPFTWRLWHLTAFVLVLVAAWLAGGIGLGVEPGGAVWWWSRPI